MPKGVVNSRVRTPYQVGYSQHTFLDLRKFNTVDSHFICMSQEESCHHKWLGMA